jgi:uncharacterized tellurite resistance protein B-like protein
MSLLARLGLTQTEPSSRSRLKTAVRDRLARLPAARAEYVAAFAGLLVRVAHVDRTVGDDERAALAAQLAARTGLNADEAHAVADLVIEEAIAGIEYAALTRSFNEIATGTEKEQLLDCLYAVATADETASFVEEEEIRAVARALMLSHQQFIAIRLRYKDKLELLKGLRARRGH